MINTIGFNNDIKFCFIYCSWYILQHPHVPAEKVWFDYWDCCLTEPISLSDIEFISINTLPSKPRSPILHIKEPSPLPFLLNWYGTVWALWSMAAKGCKAWKSVTLLNNTEIKQYIPHSFKTYQDITWNRIPNIWGYNPNNDKND